MSNYVPRNILVTGGSGFIGSNYIHQILSDNQSDIRIINYDSLTYAANIKNLEHLPNQHRYQFIKGDILDKNLLDHILAQYMIDTIVHFAAESHVDRSITDPSVFVDTNVKGTYVILESARQYWEKQFHLSASLCRFYHVSTDEVFGSLELDEKPFTETDKYTPNSPYSASKAGADHLIRAYFQTYQLPVVLSYCTNNYGLYQHTEKLIPNIISCCLNHRRISIYGNGENIRDWIYVNDHCQAIQIILTQGNIGECYNIAGHNELSNIAVAHMICKKMDRLIPQTQSYTSLIEFIGDRKGHDFRYALDDTKIRTELGWHPKIDFTTGIEHTIKFYAGTQIQAIDSYLFGEQ